MAKCLWCGEEFAPNNKIQKCCCKQHTDRYNRRAKAQDQGKSYTERDTIPARNEKIKELALRGLSCEEIKQVLNTQISVESIYNLLHKLGVKVKKRRERKKIKLKPKNTERNARIFELRRQGHSYNDIATIAGMTKHAVASLCRDYGFGGVMSDKGTKVPEDPKKYVEGYLPEQFSYVSGYVDCNSLLKIKCKDCGEIFDISMSWIRNVNCKKINCPGCARIEREQKAEAKKREQEARAEERKELAALRKAEQEAERESKKRTVKCEICGKEFTTYDLRRACCSKECSIKRMNRLTSHKRDKRIAKEKRIDKDITALGLFVRDGGVCWICGGKCNPKDYVIRKGAKICGNNYPSVDHIVPICEGGEDSWENVKLAHRICNTRRYFAEKVLDGKRVCT